MKTLHFIVTSIALTASIPVSAKPNLTWNQLYGDIRVNVSHSGWDVGPSTIIKTGYGTVTNSIVDGPDCSGASGSALPYGSIGTLPCQALSVAPIGTPWAQAGSVAIQSPTADGGRIFTDSISSSQMWYSFYVDGAVSSESVPVSLSYALGTYALGDSAPIGGNREKLSPFASAQAQIMVTDQFSQLVFVKDLYCSAGCSNFPTIQVVDLLLSTSKSYNVMIFARSNTSNYVYNTPSGDPQIFWANSTSIAGAIADPFFAINPSYANASAYNLVFSSGVVNAPLSSPGSVPEPAAWGMMIVGFGLVGASMRGRQKVAVRFA